MKLIKLPQDHYIIVDDSPIKEGDYVLSKLNEVEVFGKRYTPSLYRKITHSTQPMGIRWQQEVKKLSLHEVKKLLGEIDVEKKEIILTNHQKELLNIGNISYKDSSIIYYLPYIFINQNGKWYMQFENNKDKKYTEEDMRKAIDLAYESGMVDFGYHATDRYSKEEYDRIKTPDEIISSLTQPKTKWEVKFIDGKLKLV